MGKMKTIALLLLLTALLLPLALPANAAQTQAVWFDSQAAGDGLTVTVWTDAPVASGVITLNYDKKALTYSELTLEEACVAQHAVNAKIPGTVSISWVAPGNAQEDGVHVLMKLHFQGTDATSVTISGMAATAQGETVRVTGLDRAGLEALIADARSKQTDLYTADSVAALQTALTEAEAVLQQQLTPAKLEAAAAKLRSALQGLREPQPTNPVTEPEPTKNNGVVLIVAIGGGCLAVALAVVIVIKKRRNG